MITASVDRGISLAAIMIQKERCRVLTARSFTVSMGLVAAAGCMPPHAPEAAFDPAGGAYRVQADQAWRPDKAFDGAPAWTPPQPARTNATPSARRQAHGGSGGWGRHYPWRGQAPAPAWYGTGKHEPGKLVKVGEFYYPFYAQGKDVYPVYSMPYTRTAYGFEASYGPLPAFGPLSFERAKAGLFSRQGR
jgi:hypothetical protein